MRTLKQPWLNLMLGHNNKVVNIINAREGTQIDAITSS